MKNAVHSSNQHDKSGEIRASFGTSIVLGLRNARQEVPPTTAYLLWDSGCQGKCSFCPRANSQLDENRLSRITWPSFSLDQILQRLSNKPQPLRRICLQTGWNPDTSHEILSLTSKLGAIGFPLCVTIHPSQISLCQDLLKAGADKIGIGLDAASPETYLIHKKGDWKKDWPALIEALENRPNRIGVHLIYGLGDDEKTFISTMEAIVSRHGTVALFALTPTFIKNSKIVQPNISEYRRIQVFHYLRRKGMIEFENCKFSEGKLEFPKEERERIRALLLNGEAFRTSGCDDCNRPYYNERPGGVIYNYPRPLSIPEAKEALEESRLFG